MQVELVSYTFNPVEKIEIAASTCYDSNPTKGAIMRHCFKSGHHSVLEFADFHFKITGVSRALTHQLVRHRMASFAQRSQRYCFEDGFEFVIPPKIEANPTAIELYEGAIEDIQKIYAELVALGMPAEDARFILPNACASEINVKMNLRSLIHFFNERLCACAQWEIRQLAQLMKDAVLAVCPELKDMLVPKCEQYAPLYFCTETKSRSCGRHETVGEILAKLEEYDKLSRTL